MRWLNWNTSTLLHACVLYGFESQTLLWISISSTY